MFIDGQVCSLIDNILLEIKLANQLKGGIHGLAHVHKSNTFFGFLINTIGLKPRSHIPQ